MSWLIVNRGGLAKLTGMAVVPSQFHDCPDAPKDSQSFRNFEITVDGDNYSSLRGFIYYPSHTCHWRFDRCLVYHNPNGITTWQFWDEPVDGFGRLCGVPDRLLQYFSCPIIFYDYRGTGISQEKSDDPLSSSSFRFRPTYDSVIKDGMAVINHALEHITGQVINWGSSLGGGVATIALDRILDEHPEYRSRCQLYNHDSFTNTAQVIMPNYPNLSYVCAWLTGGLLDAQTSMRKLIELDIPITVLCHLDDPVIPAKARMAEFTSDYPQIRTFLSSEYGHANLSDDLLHQLKQNPI